MENFKSLQEEGGKIFIDVYANWKFHHFSLLVINTLFFARLLLNIDNNSIRMKSYEMWSSRVATKQLNYWKLITTSTRRLYSQCKQSHSILLHSPFQWNIKLPPSLVNHTLARPFKPNNESKIKNSNLFCCNWFWETLHDRNTSRPFKFAQHDEAIDADCEVLLNPHNLIVFNSTDGFSVPRNQLSEILWFKKHTTRANPLGIRATNPWLKAETTIKIILLFVQQIVFRSSSDEKHYI